jgi:Ca2+/H+ antiporter
MIEAVTISEGGLEMETAIIVGMVWISLLVLCLWVNYRFHRSYIANNDQEFTVEGPLSTENDTTEWSRELKASKGY